MTKLLDKAFKKAAELSENDQDELAQWLLAELESEARWSEAFEKSHDLLKSMASEAIADQRNGNTREMNPDTL